MKSKLLLVVFTAMTSLLAQYSNAQTRYMDSVFANFTLDTVTYSTVYGQKMNVYQPVGDTASVRPLIILAHGGSFYAGDRNSDITITQLCSDFAHKGYVTVSIDYRLTNPGNFFSADSAAKEVFEAVSDGKAAVRYFYKDVLTNGNSYKIDTNNIFIGGNSAGAVLFMQYAYMNDTSKLDVNPDFPPLVASIGGLEGNSGNAGYSTDFKAVINLAGGLNQADWLSHCSAPVVSAQGTLDSVVPYTCMDVVVSGFTVSLTLCGLGSLQPYIADNTPYWASMIFPGAGHVPWASSPTDFYMIDTMITSFLYKEVYNLVPDTCPPVSGIKGITNTSIKLYPNPASNQLNIQSSAVISSVSVSDEMGRVVNQISDINNLSYEMNTSGLSSGIYFIKVYSVSGYLPVVKKVTIE